MKEISKLMRKVDSCWWETSPGEDIICDKFVSEYFGVYGDQTVAYLTIKLDRNGLVLFKKLNGRWCWTFDFFPAWSPSSFAFGDDGWDEHTLYLEFQKLLQKLSKENGGIQEFRADLYITDLPSELRGKDVSQMMGKGV